MNSDNDIVWPKLKKAPVILAIFQIKFEEGNLNLSEIPQYDKILSFNFPQKGQNIHAHIDVPDTIAMGVSQISARSSADINLYSYSSESKNNKVIFEPDCFTYIDEGKYQGWENFKKSIIYTLKLFNGFDKKRIIRISVRFINKFSFTNFDNPIDFFKTTVSTSNFEGLSYPLQKYGFKLIHSIPDSSIYSIVNQFLENAPDNKFDYIFDIDVLDPISIQFDINVITERMERLRSIKNKLFFDNITSKTLETCN